jgi:hypothetical protein
VRPVLLTAAAASLGLIPIAREIFWGPMAYAMIGGIIVGTALMPQFLPVLYMAWFRIKEPEHHAQIDCNAPCFKTRSVWCAAREFGPTKRTGRNHHHTVAGPRNVNQGISALRP